MQIKIESNFQEVRRQFAAVAKQVDFAAAVALTRTAQDVRQTVRQDLPRILDRPTPYTLNSMYVRPAKKTNLEAEVFFKDGYQNKPADNKHYLVPLINGGDRRTKRFEGRLIMHGKMKRGERLVPCFRAGAEKDSYGNVNRGHITKILSQLKTSVVQGDYSNASDSKRSKAKRAINEYFWSDGPGTQFIYIKNGKRVVSTTSLARGVWMVHRTAFGNAVRPVFIVISSTNYKRIFDFHGISRRVSSQRFGFHFENEFTKALATAR